MAERQFVSINVNGSVQRRQIEPRQLLVHFLRTECGLTGTHVGCDTAYCGACTVHLDGDPVKSCNVIAVQADLRSVRTVEGLEHDDHLHALQEAFSEHHALQCGFCTPGMLMAACALLESGSEIDEASVRKALSGNVCRCTGYQNIVTAVLAAAQQVKETHSEN
ncbi:carbon-monoxide dehydrogenase small subunit [Variovorax boronicumulans]|uniref:Carbon-monoxide dehydrogenase small subunit n=1 Tax=Variovorax boronicumulans TaxID=436515 RepID=A0AAW8D984_9BURK|nr:(2Fe-2S)-binding protein [Variovorax boronicumulans]MDP9896839.1 carbon-monoxide dehydrogenase small subunit [Variovorax boronicumulans]MDP9993926.1 carbon-monoxide dehydrogenase small subunit [Variovorax boronicumulans]MDQ0005211.1 carbon-monoxide dehydrogenase small subunit [Variovorax boronicumulans]MDQ0038971.1 carbon-monoxide dehydrogenase small subunit [Variovorax boronicumulans]MDQ0044745.1 carbon-monoxide dehydrogenase small subunit [Variovorax boronicumulans]